MEYTLQEKFLADELARSLGDQENLAAYQLLAHIYPDTFLRNILSEVLDVPPANIKKSRGALFTFLVNKYGSRTPKHTRD